jgi:hypothetical protein
MSIEDKIDYLLSKAPDASVVLNIRNGQSDASFSTECLSITGQNYWRQVNGATNLEALARLVEDFDTFVMRTARARLSDQGLGAIVDQDRKAFSDRLPLYRGRTVVHISGVVFSAEDGEDGQYVEIRPVFGSTKHVGIYIVDSVEGAGDFGGDEAFRRIVEQACAILWEGHKIEEGGC